MKCSKGVEKRSDAEIQAAVEKGVRQLLFIVAESHERHGFCSCGHEVAAVLEVAARVYGTYLSNDEHAERLRPAIATVSDLIIAHVVLNTENPPC